MLFRFARSRTFVPSFVAGAFWLGFPFLLQAASDFPPGIAQGLSEADFSTRERSQSELAAWIREDPRGRVPATLAALRKSGDPEFRVRVMAALRAVADGYYGQEGQGFIGVTMLDEVHALPNRADPVSVIRIVGVMKDSPAEVAELVEDDRIVSLDGRMWTEGRASVELSERIKATKPGVEVTLGILRDGAVKDVKLRLMRRPEDLDRRDFPGGMDPEEAVRRSKEAFFLGWLREMGGELP